MQELCYAFFLNPWLYPIGNNSLLTSRLHGIEALYSIHKHRRWKHITESKRNSHLQPHATIPIAKLLCRWLIDRGIYPHHYVLPDGCDNLPSLPTGNFHNVSPRIHPYYRNKEKGSMHFSLQHSWILRCISHLLTEIAGILLLSRDCRDVSLKRK